MNHFNSIFEGELDAASGVPHVVDDHVQKYLVRGKLILKLLDLLPQPLYDLLVFEDVRPSLILNLGRYHCKLIVDEISGGYSLPDLILLHVQAF